MTKFQNLITATIIGLFMVLVVFGWTNPTENPPGGVSGGLTVSSTRVGINTSDPQYQLDVAGTFRATATSTFSGNVGIGATDPRAALEITVGADDVNLRLSRTIGQNAIIQGATNGGINFSLLDNAADDDFIFTSVQKGQIVTFEGDTGNVGIGTTSPTRKLDVIGSAGFLTNAANPIATVQYGAGDLASFKAHLPGATNLAIKTSLNELSTILTPKSSLEIRQKSSAAWTAKPAWDIAFGTYPRPAFADLDNDGDYDLMIGASDGVSYGYENTGTASSPIWTAKSAWNTVSVGQQARPALADLDNDGDYDLLIGENLGVSYGYENTGTASSLAWTAKSAWNTVDVGDNVAPAFADLDNDGDYDLMIGGGGTGISYGYKNTGTASSPTWTAEPVWNVATVGQQARPAFADLDNDGDYDLMIGEWEELKSNAYKNTGTASSPTWTAEPAWDISVGQQYSSPAFADLDNDGDYDLLIGTYSGSLGYDNTGVTSSIFFSGGDLQIKGDTIQESGMRTHNMYFYGSAGDKRYTLAYISRDTGNWRTGCEEVTVYTTYYEGGGMTKALITYGSGAAGSIRIIESAGNYKPYIYLGAEETVSGNIKQIPVYLDQIGYREYRVIWKTPREVTTSTFTWGSQIRWVGTSVSQTTRTYGGTIQVTDLEVARRSGFYHPLTTAATTFTAVGMTLPSVLGSVLAAPGANRMYIRYTCTAAAGNLGGQSGTYTETRPAFRPRFTTNILTGSTIANSRIWVGLTESALTTLAPSLAAAASTIDYVGVAYDSAVNSGKWMCCSGDGTNHSCIDMGLAAAASTEYAIVVDWSVAGSLTCTVNKITTLGYDEVTVTKTTNLSTAAVGLGVHNGVTTLEAVAKTYDIAKGVLSQQ